MWGSRTSPVTCVNRLTRQVGGGGQNENGTEMCFTVVTAQHTIYHLQQFSVCSAVV